jgi:hypothetical protein
LDVVSFRSNISEVHGIVCGEHGMHKAAQVVLKAADSMRGRQSSLQGVCAACGRDVAGTDIDRLRAGFCSACYQAWLRAGRPDRPRFEKARPKWDERNRSSPDIAPQSSKM